MKAVQLSRSNGSSSKLMRYEKVFEVFIKYGFEDLLSHPPLNKLFPQDTFIVPKRRGKKVSKYSRYERIRMVCEELGTTFIKFAQIASNRPDLLPEDLIEELEKLQDNAPKVALADIYDILNRELRRPLGELVEYFDEKPIASASMAQVHRARLIGGKEVVLKIQKPNLDRIVHQDLSILKSIVSIIENYLPKYQPYNPRELYEMFENSITEELDFDIEVNNLVYFKKMFVGNSDIFIPEVYRELCTPKVICMEYVDGLKITDLKALEAYGITGEDLAQKGIGLYFEQVFEHNFFHADPHPGNIFVLKDGRIAFIDYGMMGTIIESDKVLFSKLLLAMYEGDVEGLRRAILKFTTDLDKKKVRELEYDIMYFLRNYTNKGLEDINADEVMKGLNSLLYDYKIKIPSNLLLLVKALSIIEGVGLKLDPRYDIIENIGPYVKRLLSSRYNMTRTKSDIIQLVEDNMSLIKNLPGDIRDIFYKIKEGKLHIEFEHKGLEPWANTMDKIVNRLSFTFIIVSLLISSSIAIHANLPPQIYGISLLGFGGLVISLVFTVRLLVSISRHGRF